MLRLVVMSLAHQAAVMDPVKGDRQNVSLYIPIGHTWKLSYIHSFIHSIYSTWNLSITESICHLIVMLLGLSYYC